MREQLGIGDRFALGAARFVIPLVSAPTGGSFPASSERYDTLWHRPATTVIAGTPDAGFIGNGILGHFLLTLDFVGLRAYFEAPAAPGTRLAGTWTGTGIIADKPDHEAFEIIEILPGSAAERSGLAIGDRIIAVDGQPASDLSLSDFGNRGAAPHKSVAVTMTTGRRVDLAISQFLP